MGITVYKLYLSAGPVGWRREGAGRKGTDMVLPLGLPLGEGVLACLRVPLTLSLESREELWDATRMRSMQALPLLPRLVLSAFPVLWSTQNPAHRHSRRHFVAEETGPGSLSENIQLLGARREHSAFPSAGLAVT